MIDIKSRVNKDQKIHFSNKSRKVKAQNWQNQTVNPTLAK